ncbi:MAG: hypothetical protein ACODAQ_10500, partial [Phycisphaeraceae bacterium]
VVVRLERRVTAILSRSGSAIILTVLILLLAALVYVRLERPTLAAHLHHRLPAWSVPQGEAEHRHPEEARASSLLQVSPPRAR